MSGLLANGRAPLTSKIDQNTYGLSRLVYLQPIYILEIYCLTQDLRLLFIELGLGFSLLIQKLRKYLACVGASCRGIPCPESRFESCKNECFSIMVTYQVILYLDIDDWARACNVNPLFRDQSIVNARFILIFLENLYLSIRIQKVSF